MYECGDVLRYTVNKKILKAEVLNVSELKSPTNKLFYHVRDLETKQEFILEDDEVLQFKTTLPVPAFNIGDKIKYLETDKILSAEILEVNISFTANTKDELLYEVYYTVDNDSYVWEDDIIEWAN